MQCVDSLPKVSFTVCGCEIQIYCTDIDDYADWSANISHSSSHSSSVLYDHADLRLEDDTEYVQQDDTVQEDETLLEPATQDGTGLQPLEDATELMTEESTQRVHEKDQPIMLEGEQQNSIHVNCVH